MRRYEEEMEGMGSREGDWRRRVFRVRRWVVEEEMGN